MPGSEAASIHSCNENTADVVSVPTSRVPETPGHPTDMQNDKSQELQPAGEFQICEYPNSNMIGLAAVENIPEKEPVPEAGANFTNQANDARKTKPVAKDEIILNEQEVEEIKTDLIASKNAPLWDKYLKLSEPGDKAILADLEGSIDVTLVFAALFSAISTGFLLESSKGLNPDPSSEMVLAIRELTAVVRAGLQEPVNSGPSGASPPAGTPFKPTTSIVWVNCLWFLSLGLSISVSLFAMLAKRLCYKARLTYWGTPYERSVQRQQAWEALEKWKFKFLVEQLSMIMHIALILFFIGLVLYLSEVHLDAMIITAIPIGLTMLSYVILTMLPLVVATFPTVTPFSRYLQAGFKPVSFVTSRLVPQSFQRRLTTKIMSAVRSAARFIEGAVQFFHPHQDDRNDDKSQSGSSFTGSTNHVRREVWVIKGCSRPTADTLNYLAPQKQRYAFRALVWLLKHSNDKKLINEVLEYVNNYPEMVLDSGAGSQAHFDATLAVARHFHRLQHDAIEWHDLDQFRANCGRFMYLNARPWLHSVDSSRRRLTQKVFEFLTSNSPFMGAKEVEEEIQALKKKKLSADKCTLWLEQQAVKITLGCPPDAGLAMCKALFEFVTSKVQIDDGSVHAEEIYSTLSWMFLNTAIDSSDNRTFWPVSYENITSTDTEENNNKDSKQVANFDSTLTLSYFRHSETRQKNSLWLKTVGLSGILYAITYVYANELEPDLKTNRSYYEELVRLLRGTLESANKSQDHNSDLYIGRLPVYSKAQIRLYEFDSLKYCHDALDRAIEYVKFARFHDELKDLKSLIPVLETPDDKRNASTSLHSKSELDVNELPTLPAHPSDGSDMV